MEVQIKTPSIVKLRSIAEGAELPPWKVENLLHLKSKSLFKDLESFLTLFLIQGKGSQTLIVTVEKILAEIGRQQEAQL